MKKHPLSEVSIADLVAAGDAMQRIQSLLEDLREAGYPAKMEVEGYNFRLTGLPTEGGENYSDLDEVRTRLEHINAQLERKHGRMGGYNAE